MISRLWYLTDFDLWILSCMLIQISNMEPNCSCRIKLYDRIISDLFRKKGFNFTSTAFLQSIIYEEKEFRWLDLHSII